MRSPLARPALATAVRLLLLLCLIGEGGCRMRRSPVEPQPSVLRIGVGIGESTRGQSVNQIADLLYSEPLLNRGWDGRPSHRLAESWAWEDGGRALSLRLKEGVSLHDGTQLTSTEVSRLLKRRARGPWGFTYVTDVTARDPRTVVLRLSQPDSFLLAELTALKIVHPEAPDIATGPFKLVRREPAVEVQPFDGYHGGKTVLGGVTIVPYDTHRSAWAALMRGEVDAAQEVSRDSVEFIERGSTVRTYPTIQPFYIPLVFNLRHSALQHVEVRRALNEAVDRAGILARAMRGRGRVADGPIWPLHWAFDQHVAHYRFDPVSARLRLDAAGFPIRSGKSASAANVRFSFKCLVWNEDPQFERIALMIQRQLFDVGVDIQFESVALTTLTGKARVGDFDSFLVQANASRMLDHTYRMWRSTADRARRMQDSGYVGADEQLDRLRGSISETDTRGALAALAQKFHEDAPAVFIAWMEVTRAVDSRFDVSDTAAPDPFASIWRWRPVATAHRR